MTHDSNNPHWMRLLAASASLVLAVLAFGAGAAGARGGGASNPFRVLATITSFSPASGVAGTPVSINGSALAGATGVSFAGETATIVSNTATKIVARVPATAAEGAITVTTPGGAATSAASFKPLPKLIAAVPSPAQAGNTLVLAGSNLLAATKLVLGTVQIPIATVDSATQITTGALPDTALTGALKITTPTGTSAALILRVRPTVTGLSTLSAPVGTSVTVTGKSFAGTTKVTFGAPTATASFKSITPTSLTATVPTSAVTGPVTVTNAGGSTASSDSFAVIPKITSFSPGSGVANTAVTINGTGLAGATNVSFGGAAATTTVSDTATKLVARVPATASQGAISVTASGDTAVSTLQFKPLPKLTAAAPSPARAGDTLVLTGSNLLAATKLVLGPLQVPIATIDSATQITTGALPDTALSGALKVTTPTGTSASITLGVRPTIVPLATSSATVGTSITITGKTFTGTKSVTFGAPGAKATFNSVTATSLKAVVPATAVTGPITITNAGGSTASATFDVLPKISTFTPAVGYPGTTVTINGTGFTSATEVKLGGTAVSSFTVVSSTKITTVVAPGTASGKVDVTTASGTAVSTASLSIQPFVLHVNLSATDVDFVDPALAYFPPSWQLEDATCALLLDYPDSPAPAGAQLQPDVAAALPLVSNDGMTYTFTIRPGFAFSPPSGETVTAETFKFVIERALNPAMQSPAGAFMGDIVGAQDYMAGNAGSISGIVVVDPQTLQITLEQPTPDFLARLAMPFFCALPTTTPLTQLTGPVPSAGPYSISSYTQGSQIVLTRNPNYGGTRSANPDSIVYTTNTDLTQSFAQILSGTADYDAGGTTFTDWATALKKVPKQSFVNPVQEVDYLGLNTSRPLFSSVAARKAVNLVVNRAQLTAIHGPSGGTPTDQYLPPGMAGFRDAKIYPLNGPSGAQLAQANALVNQAGIRGQTAVIYTSSRGTGPALAENVKSALARIGIRSDIQPFSTGVMYEKAGTKGEPFDIVIASWSADYADPFDFLNVLLDGTTIHDSGNNDMSYFDDPDYNAKLAAAQQLTGAARSTAYGNLDVDLVSNASPLVAYDNRNARDVFSARMGCQTYQPVYGMDLATLCVK